MPRIHTAGTLFWGSLSFLAAATASAAPPFRTVDLATLSADAGGLLRVYGASGTGRLGVPVTGGFDVDGDGRRDVAVAYFSVDPLGRPNAGEVDLIFGDGTIRGSLDTAVDSPSVLRIYGAGPQETAGTEIWMDDVTGDGVGDLLIGRQNYTPDAERMGAGALTIIAGGPALSQLAAGLAALDLAAPPPEVQVTTFVGAAALDRLGIWMRTGDVDGDGVADVVTSADQEDAAGEENRGAVYVIRGGAHLAASRTIDLADFGATALAGHLAKVTPPAGSARYHFGATCLAADLDGNGKSEVLAAATILRGSATVPAAGAPPLSAEANAGSPDGTVYVAWDDNFPAAEWTPGYTFDVTQPPGTHTVLDGGFDNRKFGEELAGGGDYDADGQADLFVGDLFAGDLPDRFRPGVGYVFYGAAALKGLEVGFDDLPAGLRVTTILGPSRESIAADSAAQGDFDGDGVADLAVTAPYANPDGRLQAGVIHVFYGRPGGWPERIDTAPESFPDPALVRITELRGGLGATPGDGGDTIGYSVAAADVDGDGRAELIANEMQGNGLAPGSTDVGNLIVVGGTELAGLCGDTPTARCLNGERYRVEIEWRDFNGNTGAGRVVPVGSSDSGLFWFFSPDNWEMLVKVLDGCAVNGHVWVFAAATTNVEYTLRVTDALTGEEHGYFNPLGTSADAITDTGAFASCP